MTRYRFAGIVSVMVILAVCGAESEAGTASPVSTTTALTITSGGSVLASGATVTAGSEVTLTATVNAGAAGVTTGEVNFCDASAAHCSDIFLLGTAQLTSNGTAVLRLHPGPGNQSYKAIFMGTSSGATMNTGSISGAVGLTVTAALPTTTTITSSGSPGNYTLTATVTGSSSAVAITGTTSFLDSSNGNFALGTSNLVAGSPVLSFVNSDNPATGNLAQSTVTADFNGDGFADVAIANYVDGTVSIELGKGDGTFTPAPNSPVAAGQTPFSLAVGDFNSDGIPDLVAADVYGGYVTVLLEKVMEPLYPRRTALFRLLRCPKRSRWETLTETASRMWWLETHPGFPLRRAR